MLELRCFAHSDRGRVRPANQDTAHADARLLAVADGYGPAGGTASSAAVKALKVLDARGVPAGSVLNVLQEAVEGATAAVREGRRRLGGGGRYDAHRDAVDGSQLALVHIGDSRAYLLRDGALFRITHDHTVVQSMIDEGRPAPEEATAHPRAALLLKALTAGPSAAPDLRLHDARPGDRYLLCSDGLSGVVPDDGLRRVPGASPAPDAAVLFLVTAANEAGGPDNVSCVVADVVETGG